MTQDHRDIPGTDLAPVEPPQGEGRPSPLWYAGVAFASLLVMWYPLLGTIVLGGVLRSIVARSGRVAWPLSVISAAVVPVVAAVAFGPSAGLVMVPPLVSTFLVVLLMQRGQAGVTGVSVVVALATLVSLALDAYTVGTQGHSLAEVSTSLLMASVQASAGSGIDGQMVVSVLAPFVSALWPLLYVFTSLVNVAGAGVGSYLASARTASGMRFPQLANFDAPLWSVAALALSVLGIGASFAGVPGSEVVLTISATAFMSVRVIFALQGFGVLSAQLAKLRLGCLLRTLVIFFAVWIETMFFVLSIVGLVDVWANFRKLSRDGAHSETQQ